jgi:hypothetical protein
MPPSQIWRLLGFLGEELRHPGNALVADPHCRDGRGIGIPESTFRLEDSCDVLQGLAAELAEDRGKLKGSRGIGGFSSSAWRYAFSSLTA